MTIRPIRPLLGLLLGRPLLAMLLVAGVVRLTLALLTPPLYAADEAGHMLYVHQVAAHLDFPVQSRNGTWADQGGANEFYQPPLFYALAAIIVRPLIGFGDTALYAVRLFDVGLGVAAVFIMHRIALTVFEGRRDIALGAAAVAALLPTLAGLNASAGNDSLDNLLVFAATWLLLRQLRARRIAPLSSLALAGLTAAALYTKTSAIVLLPSILLVGFWLQRFDRLAMLKAASAAGVALLAILPWWIFRNLAAYGDLLGVDIGWHRNGSPFLPALVKSVYDIAWSFYIAFGRIYDVQRAAPLAFILAIGSVLLLWRAIRMVRAGELSRAQIEMASVLGLQFLLAFGAALSYGIKFGLTEGRYLFPALPAVAITLSWAACSIPLLRSSERTRLIVGATGALVALVLSLQLAIAYSRVVVDARVGGPMYATHTGDYGTWVAHRETPIN